MKCAKLKLPIFNFDIDIIQVEENTDEEAENLREQLTTANVSKENIDKAICSIKENRMNGAVIYKNEFKIAMVFFFITTKAKRIKLYAHEKRHIEDAILEHCGINDKETAAYLAGYLAEKLHVFDKWDEDDLKREFNYFNKTKKKAT